MKLLNMEIIDNNDNFVPIYKSSKNRELIHAKDLHEMLEINTQYSKWIERELDVRLSNKELLYVEKVDYFIFNNRKDKWRNNDKDIVVKNDYNANNDIKDKNDYDSNEKELGRKLDKIILLTVDTAKCITLTAKKSVIARDFRRHLIKLQEKAIQMQNYHKIEIENRDIVINNLRKQVEQLNEINSDEIKLIEKSRESVKFADLDVFKQEFNSRKIKIASNQRVVEICKNELDRLSVEYDNEYSIVGNYIYVKLEKNCNVSLETRLTNLKNKMKLENPDIKKGKLNEIKKLNIIFNEQRLVSETMNILADLETLCNGDLGQKTWNCLI